MDQTHPSIHPKDRKLSNLGWNLNLLQFTKFITIADLILLQFIIFMIIFTFDRIRLVYLGLIIIVPSALTIIKVIEIFPFFRHDMYIKHLLMKYV